MADLKDWGTTASGNDVASPAGANTGWTGSQVGPWARETMAAVARWYNDPTWFNPLKELAPSGNKTVASASTSSIAITAGSNWSETDAFSTGRLIRLIPSGGTGAHVYAFIVSKSATNTILTVNLAVIGDTALTHPTTFSQNGIEFYGGQDTTTTDYHEQALGAVAFSGAGTTTERDSRFPDVTSVPEGILWANTTDNLLQIVVGSAGSRTWRGIAPLTSAWSGAGGNLDVESTTTHALLSVDSPANYNSAVRLQENNTKRSRFVYDANANQTVIEGGDSASYMGQIRINDSDGKLEYRQWDDGVAQTAVSLTPGAGNGLDADTVDGIHASALQNVFSILDSGGGSYTNGEAGSFRLSDGTTTLLVQWPVDSDWTTQFTSRFNANSSRWTFPTAYADVPIILGGGLVRYLRSSNSSFIETVATSWVTYSSDTTIWRDVTSAHIEYLPNHNNYTVGLCGIPIAIGIAAS